MAKRLFDFCSSFIGLIILLPLLILISITIKIGSYGPVLFSQKRVGKDGKLFTLIKFRSMTVNQESKSTTTARGDVRITKIGAFLRKYKLDELPELWNVLKGDMSLVGPRPLLMEYLPLYSASQRRRHELKPGITGWAQVNGRNAISWEEKFKYDVWYVENQSFFLAKILITEPLPTCFSPSFRMVSAS